MIDISRLVFASFVSPDPQRLLDYYRTVLGVTGVHVDSGTYYLASPLGETCVTIRRGDVSRCDRIVLQLRAGSDLTEVRTWLSEHGIPAASRTDAYPELPETLEFTDANGTSIEVFTDAVPRAVVGDPQGVAPRKLGHIAFITPDIGRTVSFYRDILGFRESDWMGDFFAFMRCGPDHHTVNFISGDAPRMHHMAFELEDWNHVKHAIDWLSKKDIRLLWGPGRHGIGSNIFTYHRNPDDQMIELFTELDTMSDESRGYWDPRPWHSEFPQYPKRWTPEGDSSNLWGAPAPQGHRK